MGVPGEFCLICSVPSQNLANDSGFLLLLLPIHYWYYGFLSGFGMDMGCGLVVPRRRTLRALSSS